MSGNGYEQVAIGKFVLICILAAALYPVLSANKRFIAFASRATSLVPDDTNRSIDIFVHDRQTGEISRVSIANDGSEGNNHSMEPDISADGHAVVFTSNAENLVGNDANQKTDIFMHNQQTGEIRRISENNLGACSSGGIFIHELVPEQ